MMRYGEGRSVSTTPELTARLARMEAACRQTRDHLALVERQIAARANRMTVTARTRGRPSGPHGTARSASGEKLFHQHVEDLAFARRSEIEALSRKLSRQERAIAALRIRHGFAPGETDTQPWCLAWAA